MKKLGKLIYCALGAALVLTGCGKKDGKGGKFVKTEDRYFSFNFRSNSVINDYFDEFEYNKDGLVTLRSSYRYNKDVDDYLLSSSIAYTYDENGNCLTEETKAFNFVGEITYRNLYVYSDYNEYGKYGTRKFYQFISADKYSKPVLNEIKTYIREYDAAGNVTKFVELYDDNSANVELKTYDDLGRVTSYMNCYTESYRLGYTFTSKSIYSYFDGSESEMYKTYVSYSFVDGAWVEGFSIVREMNEEGIITYQASMSGGKVLGYVETEKVSETKLVKTTYNFNGDKPVVYEIDECEYRNEEALFNTMLKDEPTVDLVHRETRHYESNGFISSAEIVSYSYDEFGNSTGFELISYQGDGSSDELTAVSTSVRTYKYEELK